MIFQNPKIDEIFSKVEATVSDSGQVRGILQKPNLVIVSTYKLKESDDFQPLYDKIRDIVGGEAKPVMNVEPQSNGRTLVRITVSFNIWNGKV